MQSTRHSIVVIAVENLSVGVKALLVDAVGLAFAVRSHQTENCFEIFAVA